MTAALYLDECIDSEVAVRLRGDGYDILTTLEAGRLGSGDEDQLDFATQQRRIFFTHNIKASGPSPKAGRRSGDFTPASCIVP